MMYPSIETPIGTVALVALIGDMHSTEVESKTRAGTDAEPNRQAMDDELTKESPYITTNDPPDMLPTVGEQPVTMTSSRYLKF